MENLDELIFSVAKRLAHTPISERQLSSIAADLEMLRNTHFASDRVAALVQRFAEVARLSGCHDLLGSCLAYAIRLANASGSLSYEEMHRMLSLCDEIDALKSLGFIADQGIWVDFEKSVRRRLAADSAIARFAAEDRVEPWNREAWWYAVSLSDITG